MSTEEALKIIIEIKNIPHIDSMTNRRIDEALSVAIESLKILNEIIESYNKNEYPEYFQDEVSEIFKREGISDITSQDEVKE